MNETIRTLTFSGTAAVSLVIAWFAAPSSEIRPPEFQTEGIGKEFFPDFKDPNVATSLRVVTFDEAQARVKPFVVEFKNGHWTIPSHHNYPADGADRLAKTSASVIGIRRDEPRSSSEADFEELGVIDPLSDNRTQLKGYGQRITLTKGSGDVLADLIVGKQVKGRQGYYFVRRPDEKSTYVTKVDIDLSTKFADWIETDLLKLDAADLAEIVLDNYSIDEVKQRIVPGDRNDLIKINSASPWTLKGLDDKTEELDSAKVSGIVSALDDLKLVGVRLKPKGLSDDLKMEEGIRLDMPTALDLQSKGFMITQKRGLVSNEGELLASTTKGVKYILCFGEVFTGDEVAVEVGIEADKKKAEADKKKTSGNDEKLDDSKSSRYLFVTAGFDETHLGPKPQKPVKAAPPTDAKSEPAKPDSPPAADKKPEPEKKTEPEKKPESETKSESETKPDEPKPDAAKPEAEKKPEAPSNETKSKPEEKQKTSPEGTSGDGAALNEGSQEQAAEEPKPAAEPAGKAAPASNADSQPANGDEKKPSEGDKSDAQAKKAEPKAESKPETKPESKPEPKTEAKPEGKPEVKAAPFPVAKPAPVDPKKVAEDLEKEYKTALAKYDADLKAYNTKVAAGEELARKLNRRFADWYYVISADSFSKLHVSRKELVKPKAAAPAADAKPGATPEKKPVDEPSVEEKKTDDKKPEDKKPEEKKTEDKPSDEKKEEKKADEKKSE